MIFYEKSKRIFALNGAGMSYVIGINAAGYPVHLYFGDGIPDLPFEENDILRERFPSFIPSNPKIGGHVFSADITPLEYSGSSVADFRMPAVSVKNANGDVGTDLRYVSHKISKGKPAADGMPLTYCEDGDGCETLTLFLRDPATGVSAELYYTVFSDVPVIARRAVIINGSGSAVSVECAFSASFSLRGEDFDMIRLYGRYFSERSFERTPLPYGKTSVVSRRGASSHYMNPFTALVGHGTTEEYGDAYGFSLLWSGNFEIAAERDFCNDIRVNAGLCPDGFSYHLEPGESFVTPEAAAVYSGHGLGGMSRAFHKLVNRHIVRGEWKDRKRPLLINSWEAAYMNIDTGKLLVFAKEAKELGIEMLVMDDGWFGKRFDDRSSLGDWYVNEEKFPGGLGELVLGVRKLGLKFGIWFEPEMISPDSDLYRAHPDWCVHLPGRERSVGRHQYVLDVSRKDVRDNVFSQMEKILSEYDVDYLKWDFNRNVSEPGSALLPPERACEFSYRFVLGTYELLERLTKRFPSLLIESCSGGGGRFDLGMLYYAPQAWCSDNTSALDRIPIQFGTSLCYPASTMGAHVSANRSTDYNTKGVVAMWGSFGYELDPAKLTDSEKETVRRQVAEYHDTYDLIHSGELYRLVCPWDGKGYVAWEFVSEDRERALISVVNTAENVCRARFIKAGGLDPDKYYRLGGTERVFSGKFLMSAGINVSDRPHHLGEAFTLDLKAVK
ncbi:MAG: alpha-galactosidase [Clostridia bacterium]|nr:alpha-galactosidase [Clostridia bacterium]